MPVTSRFFRRPLFAAFGLMALLATQTAFAQQEVPPATQTPAQTNPAPQGGTVPPATEAPTGTLDLSLQTGAPAVKPQPKVETKKPAAKPQAKPSRTASRRGLPPLPSRGASSPRGQQPVSSGQTAPKVLGKLGVVTAEGATIRADRASTARALSIVGKGTNLAIVSESPTHYGVLMVDNTIGWIDRNEIEMIDYQVQVNVPTPPTAEEPAPSPSSSRSDLSQYTDALDPRTESMLREAFTYLGVPYVWAGNTRRGIDCSGFLKAVLARQGVTLPRHSGDQAKVGTKITALEDLRAGDRLYFDMGNKGRVSHCGIYLGNGYFIHASSNRHCVDVDRLTQKNYYNALVAARRDW